MEPKNYQREVIGRLQGYVRELEKNAQAFENAGLDLDANEHTWTKAVKASSAPHKSYFDGNGRSIPNLCLKVPTGGGKTFMATHAIDVINAGLFKRQTGFILWIVPKDAIYQQTIKALSNRAHPYRDMLERISGGRVKIFEKGSVFTPHDVANNLCVMFLMLQSSNRKTKDTLRMFKDSGRFPDFFPQVDDIPAQNELLNKVNSLEAADTLGEAADNVLIKHSLGNVLRLLRPIIVLDEGHIAASDLARDTLTSFNPRFILELTATPNPKRNHVSNVLCDVSGRDLKDEEMLKLPIQVRAHNDLDWQQVLETAWHERVALERHAKKLLKNENRYIRPIMLVRVERTGNDQLDNDFIHAENVRNYLMTELAVPSEQIAVKSSSKDEIKGHDLLSKTCPIRVIITKDALKEGWDCPFAYQLVVLSPTTSMTALTQMIGRILRQPNAKLTNATMLDQCYVHCMDERVEVVVGNIAKALDSEGMGDLSDQIQYQKGKANSIESRTILRRPEFKGRKIFMPRVLMNTDSTQRALEYDKDILAHLNWDSFKYHEASEISLATNDKSGTRRLSVTIGENLLHTDYLPTEVEFDAVPTKTFVDRPYLVRQLMSVIPNPWQSARIIDEALAILRKRKIDEQTIIDGQTILIQHMKERLRLQIDEAAENLFKHRIATGEISFSLVGYKNDFTLPDEQDVTLTEDSLPLFSFANPAKKTLFETVFKGELNGFEENVALFMDQAKAIKWWHRIAVNKRSYSIQGWKRNKIYPDFLCEIEPGDESQRMLVLETKGKHLDNEDTAFKRRLFEVLEEAYQIGTVDLIDDQAHEIRFAILMQSVERDAWKMNLEPHL